MICGQNKSQTRFGRNQMAKFIYVKQEINYEIVWCNCTHNKKQGSIERYQFYGRREVSLHFETNFNPNFYEHVQKYLSW